MLINPNQSIYFLTSLLTSSWAHTGNDKCILIWSLLKKCIISSRLAYDAAQIQLLQCFLPCCRLIMTSAVPYTKLCCRSAVSSSMSRVFNTLAFPHDAVHISQYDSHQRSYKSLFSIHSDSCHTMMLLLVQQLLEMYWICKLQMLGIQECWYIIDMLWAIWSSVPVFWYFLSICSPLFHFLWVDTLYFFSLLLSIVRTALCHAVYYGYKMNK